MNPLRREASKYGMGSAAGDPDDTDAIYNIPAPALPFNNSDNIHGMVVQHDTKLFGAEANIVRPFGIPGLARRRPRSLLRGATRPVDYPGSG